MRTKSIFFLLAAMAGISLIACKQNKNTGAENTLSDAERTAYLEKGKSIAGETFTVLSTQLQAAMQDGGVQQAINYCQLNAYPLVDSLSKKHHAEIRRTTLKARNPENRPSDLEHSILETYAQKEAGGETLTPMVQALEGQEVAFFAPIRTNAFCLQCHGKPGETIKEEDYALISRHYPEDQAINYQEGDLRGMWSIRFKSLE